MNTFLIILMLFLPIPMYILYKKKFENTMERNKAFELKRAFNYLLRKYKLSIDEVDIFNNKIIGLDRKKSKSIWIEHVDTALRQHCVSLNELESHKVTKVVNRIEGCFSKIVMEFFSRDQKPATFTFYDRSRDDLSTFSYLLAKAKYRDTKIHFHVNAYNSRHAFEYVL
jgi:hypothetical protein